MKLIITKRKFCRNCDADLGFTTSKVCCLCKSSAAKERYLILLNATEFKETVQEKTNLVRRVNSYTDGGYKKEKTKVNNIYTPEELMDGIPTREQFFYRKHTTILKSSRLTTKEDEILEYIFRIRFPELKHYRRELSSKRYTYSTGYKHIFPLSGTILYRSPTPLTTWFRAIYLILSTRGNISCKELQKKLKVTYKCAWRIKSQIRKHLNLKNYRPTSRRSNKEFRIALGLVCKTAVDNLP